MIDAEATRSVPSHSATEHGTPTDHRPGERGGRSGGGGVERDGDPSAVRPELTVVPVGDDLAALQRAVARHPAAGRCPAASRFEPDAGAGAVE